LSCTWKSVWRKPGVQVPERRRELQKKHTHEFQSSKAGVRWSGVDECASFRAEKRNQKTHTHTKITELRKLVWDDPGPSPRWTEEICFAASFGKLDVIRCPKQRQCCLQQYLLGYC
jgi:hypothetical protein